MTSVLVSNIPFCDHCFSSRDGKACRHREIMIPIDTSATDHEHARWPSACRSDRRLGIYRDYESATRPPGAVLATGCKNSRLSRVRFVRANEKATYDAGFLEETPADEHEVTCMTRTSREHLGPSALRCVDAKAMGGVNSYRPRETDVDESPNGDGGPSTETTRVFTGSPHLPPSRDLDSLPSMVGGAILASETNLEADFIATVTKTDTDQQIGMMVTFPERTYLVVHALMEEGAVPSWNAVHEEHMQILEGDYIVQINDRSTDAEEMMKSMMDNDTVHVHVCRRAQRGKTKVKSAGYGFVLCGGKKAAQTTGQRGETVVARKNIESALLLSELANANDDLDHGCHKGEMVCGSVQPPCGCACLH